MERREFLQFGLTGSAYLAMPGFTFFSDFDHPSEINKREAQKAIHHLQGEPVAHAEVQENNGTPRLFLNGQERYPLLAWSWKLIKNTPMFKKAGIHLLNPYYQMNMSWKGPGQYDWEQFDLFLGRLLHQNPNAYFIPRILLSAPKWWKDQHSGEMIQYALQTDHINQKREFIDEERGEGGIIGGWGGLYHASFASQIWRQDTGNALRALLRHIEQSPLRSRIIGIQLGHGTTLGEWHYFGSNYLPDVSDPMKQACGYVPDAKERTNTRYGLLRDPELEKNVIDYYNCFHHVCADTLLYFAKIVKEETNRRILCGAFFTYLMENIWIQEGGHLAPESVLASPDIDFLAAPYSYQSGNTNNNPSDVYDHAGNWLGRDRGVGGDGGYRTLPESVRRHGKLNIVEIDPGTYLDDSSSSRNNGGAGSQTVEGTLRILERDFGQMYVSGSGGWLTDHGPRFDGSWYAAPPIIKTIRRFAEQGEKRAQLDLGTVSQIASVYDPKTFFATAHWHGTYHPKETKYTDFFNYWFLDAQARALHRIGAPADFLYRFDLKPGDAQQYRLIFMINLFFLTDQEIVALRNILRNSGSTVVWFYAPGFISPNKLDIKRMEHLTGFTFSVREKPGSFMIQSSIPAKQGKTNLHFGIKEKYFPRFSVEDKEAEILGHWVDTKKVAFARKEMDGWYSVYMGTAPVPVEILRWLASEAGATLWSDKPDIIKANKEAAMLVSTQKGTRRIRLPVPMALSTNGKAKRSHSLKLDFGEVKIFTANS